MGQMEPIEFMDVEEEQVEEDTVTLAEQE